MIDAFGMLLLGAHLIVINLAVGAPFVCALCEVAEARGIRQAGEAGRFLTASSLITLLLGSSLGLGAGFVLYYAGWFPEFSTAWRLLERKMFWGAWELGFSAVVILLHWCWWRAAAGSSKRGMSLLRGMRILLPLASGANLLYHFPPLFVLFAKFAEGDPAFLDAEGIPAEGPLSAAAFRPWMLHAEVLARWLHFTFASFASAGLLLAWQASAWKSSVLQTAASQTAPDSENRADAPLARWGLYLACGATFLQIPVGLWVMTSLPPFAQARLMGQSIAASLLLASGVLAALGLMHVLVNQAAASPDRRRVLRASALFAIVVLLMTAASLASRAA